MSKEAEDEEIEILDRIIDQLSRRAREMSPIGTSPLPATKSERMER